jgi:DNA polymerase-3 subunit delta
MPATAVSPSTALVLICGEDDFTVKQRARELYLQWTGTAGGLDHEIIDAAVTNSGEALKALGRLREALQTLPFFGNGKVIWLKNCNFLGDDRTASSEAVTEGLAAMAQDLKELPWSGASHIRLLVSASKVDKRKLFYKTLDKLGAVEAYAGWSVDDRDWADQAETWARKALRARQKEISEEALAELTSRIGPNAGQLESEVEKVSLYVGERGQIEFEDVAAVCARNKTARAFALGDALGDRDLPRLLLRLDEELWDVKLDPKKSEIGLLYGLISKVRAMILLKEMLREGWVKAGMDYGAFKSQLERAPREQLPEDRRFNPLAINSYVLFKALPQVKRYDHAELVRAMELLFQCNLRMVSGGGDQSLVLQQALIQIAGKPASRMAVTN